MTTRTIEDIRQEMTAKGLTGNPAAAPQPVAAAPQPPLQPLGTPQAAQPSSTVEPVQPIATGSGVGMGDRSQQRALAAQQAVQAAATAAAAQQSTQSVPMTTQANAQPVADADTYLPPDHDTLPSGVPVRVNEDQPIGLYFEYQKRLVSATGGKTSNVASALPVNQWLGTRTIELYVGGRWRPITLDDYAGTSPDGLRLKIKDGARLDGLVGKLLEASQDQEM